MSGFRFSHNLSFSREDREEIVIVTSKQYLAVADDFLRKLIADPKGRADRNLRSGFLISSFDYKEIQ
jgi:hypothetical protein